MIFCNNDLNKPLVLQLSANIMGQQAYFICGHVASSNLITMAKQLSYINLGCISNMR